MCPNVTIKTPERRQSCCPGIFIVNAEHLSHIDLLFLLLNLNRKLSVDHEWIIKYIWNGSFLFFNLTILTRKDLCFIQFSTGKACWLLLIFFICLHNQLSFIHSIISTVVWKIWFIKKTVKMNGCSFQHVYGKIWVSLCLNTGECLFLEVSFSNQQKDHRFF